MRNQLRHAEMFFTPRDALMYYSIPKLQNLVMERRFTLWSYKGRLSLQKKKKTII